MLFDEQRNSFYARAIRKNVTRDSVVLDLGSGFGIHGFIAAAAGARHVYLVDPAIDAEIIRRIAKLNNLSDRITVIHKKIEETELPESVDVIISVFTGNFLYEEDLLPSLFYARDKYLKTDGKLLPTMARQEAVPITCEKYYDEIISSWSNPSQDIHFETLREFAANNLFPDYFDAIDHQFLAEVASISEIDLSKASDANCQSSVEFRFTHDGKFHGILGWFQMKLDGDWLSTSPLATKTHWRQVLLPLDPALDVHAGETMTFSLSRPEYGVWSWTVHYQDTTQKHSTFLARPLSPEKLSKKSGSYTAKLADKGEATLFVLGKLNGNLATDELAVLTKNQYPSVFPDIEAARRFIIELIDQYC